MQPPPDAFGGGGGGGGGGEAFGLHGGTEMCNKIIKSWEVLAD